MQTASGTLAAAIAAAENNPVHAVTVDWDSDGVGFAGNMIPDPDFELGTGLASWSGYVPGGAFLANTTFRDVASGASIPETGGVAPTAQSGSKMRFVAFGAPGSAGGMHGVRLVTTVGQQYTATFRVQIPSSPSSGTVLRLRAWDRGALVADSTTTSTTASWVTLTVTWTPTSQYTWIGIYATGTAAAQVYAFIDNVSVTVAGTVLGIDDLSGQVISITVDRSLSTDLPDSAQLVTGYAAAEATIVVGDVTPNTGLASAAAQYSPYNPASPLYGKQEFAPLAIQLGHRTTAGPETLPVFSGQVREIQSEADGTITITALDGAERMRGPATLPVVAADDGSPAGDVNGVRPGLNSQYPIDWLARSAGFYASPPTRAKCVLSVPLHGSAMPEVGSPWRLTWDKPIVNTVSSFQVPFRQGKFGMAVDSLMVPYCEGLFMQYRPDPGQQITLNNGATVFCECWFYADTNRVTSNVIDTSIIDMVTAQRTGTGVGVGMVITAGKLTASLSRGTVNALYVGPTIPTDNSWHYAAIQVTVSANGATVDIQYRLDGATTTRTALAGGGSVTTGTPLDQYLIIFGAQHLPVEAVQMTAEDANASWNDAFMPTAILDPGLNELVATPVISTNTDRWQLLCDITAAEYGTNGFDELGRLIFRNAEANRRNSTVTQVMTSRANMLSATVDRAKDQIRNHITATVKAPTIGALTDVFQAQAIPILLPGLTFTIITELDKPTFGISGPIWLQPGLYDGLTFSSCVANSNASGTGTIITSGVAVYATVYNGTTVRLDCLNTTNSIVYLVFPSTETTYVPGSPGIVLRGHPIDWSTTVDTPIDIQDTASIARYGEQGYDVPSSDWLQQPTQVTSVLQTLLSVTRKPRPILSNLVIAEDCRLQLADRVQLVDTDTGLTLGEEYVVTGIRTERSDSGAEQSLTVRQLTSPGGWVLGRPGRMKLGTQTRLL